MDINLLESVQRRMTKMIHNVSHLEYPDRLKALGLHSLERRRCRGDIIVFLRWKKGINKGDISQVLKMKEEGITQSNGFKLDKFKFKKDIEELVWWNSPPPAIINSISIDRVKTKLDSCMGSVGWI